MEMDTKLDIISPIQVQYGAYTTVGGLTSVIKLMFAGLLFLMLVKFNFGRKLLLKVRFLLISFEI